MYEFEKDRSIAQAAAMDERMSTKMAKYRKQKDEISKTAKGFDDSRAQHRAAADAADKHAAELTIATVLFQIAIAVGSVAALSKKKPLWYASMVIAVYAVFQTFNGVYLWV
jgi:hypothetical protein